MTCDTLNRDVHLTPTRGHSSRREEEEETHEEIALKKLRNMIQDIIREDEKFDDDYFLLQWLKARNLNPESAETMIRNSLKWRKENDIDRLLYEDFPQDITEEFSCAVYLNDKDRNGVPVTSIPVGKWKVREVVEKKGKAYFVRFLSQIFIKSEKVMIDYNKRRNQNNPPGTKITSKSTRSITCLITAEDYSMRNTRSLKTVMAMLEATKNFDNYFPQLVETAYLINVDHLFTVILKMLTPLLSIPVLEVFDHDKTVWKPFVLERISPEQIYPEFGGTRTSRCTGHLFYKS